MPESNNAEFNIMPWVWSVALACPAHMRQKCDAAQQLSKENVGNMACQQ
jgi:hypothetical protein